MGDHTMYEGLSSENQTEAMGDYLNSGLEVEMTFPMFYQKWCHFLGLRYDLNQKQEQSFTG